MASSNRLNIVQMRAEFIACQNKSEGGQEDILLCPYVSAYKELLKIVQSLGRVFYFVVQDVQDKLNILTDYLSKEPDNYRTLETMIHFEQNNGRLTPKCPTNGSRTYLRLHRALLFIFRFIQELVSPGLHSKTDKSDASKGRSLGEMTQTVYTETLSQYHPWLIRKGVAVAVLALPSRNDFLKHLSKDSGIDDTEVLFNFLRESLVDIQETYAISQLIYSTNDVLNLD